MLSIEFFCTLSCYFIWIILLCCLILTNSLISQIHYFVLYLIGWLCSPAHGKWLRKETPSMSGRALPSALCREAPVWVVESLCCGRMTSLGMRIGVTGLWSSWSLSLVLRRGCQLLVGKNGSAKLTACPGESSASAGPMMSQAGSRWLAISPQGARSKCWPAGEVEVGPRLTPWGQECSGTDA